MSQADSVNSMKRFSRAFVAAAFFILPILLVSIPLAFIGCKGQQSDVVSAKSNSSETDGGSVTADELPSLPFGSTKLANTEKKKSGYGNLVLPQPNLPDLPELSPDLKPLTDKDLHKNFTLLMLAYEPDIRAMSIVAFLRNVVDSEQRKAAYKFALKYEPEFQQLMKRRDELLANAVDGVDHTAHLRRIDEETVYLSRRIRSAAYNQILTDEQRAKLKEIREQRAAELARIAEKKKQIAEKERLADKENPGSNVKR